MDSVEKYKEALRKVRDAIFGDANIGLINDTLFMPDSPSETVLDYINHILDDDDYIDPSQR